jgi:hypothetical protein
MASTNTCDGCGSCPCSWPTCRLYPFDPEAANLMFIVLRPLQARQLDRHEQRALSGLGVILVAEDHHAEILALKGDSYRLRDKDLATPARD